MGLPNENPPRTSLDLIVLASEHGFKKVAHYGDPNSPDTPLVIADGWFGDIGLIGALVSRAAPRRTVLIEGATMDSTYIQNLGLPEPHEVRPWDTPELIQFANRVRGWWEEVDRDVNELRLREKLLAVRFRSLSLWPRIWSEIRGSLGAPNQLRVERLRAEQRIREQETRFDPIAEQVRQLGEAYADQLLDTITAHDGANEQVRRVVLTSSGHFEDGILLGRLRISDTPFVLVTQYTD